MPVEEVKSGYQTDSSIHFCCATRDFVGSGELVFSGADAGRGGICTLFTGFCGRGGGWDCCCCICCGSEKGEFVAEDQEQTCALVSRRRIYRWRTEWRRIGPGHPWGHAVRPIQGVLAERADGGHLWKYRNGCRLRLQVLAKWIIRRLCWEARLLGAKDPVYCGWTPNGCWNGDAPNAPPCEKGLKAGCRC